MTRQFCTVSLLIALCIGLSPAVALAIDTDFTISTLVGSDTEIPSTPTNVVATPVATTQIDVSWSASTDNVSVAGYQVFRDATHIATTTSLTYSDTGLTASTTYEYTIRAFDTSDNFSLISATSATTTLAPVATSTPTTTPETDTDTGGSGSVTQLLRISDVTAAPGTDHATISFTTTRATQAMLAWGRGGDYELGYSNSALYQTDHKIIIPNLVPGTIYQFRITVVDGRGKTETYTGSFWTEMVADQLAPPNPMNFRAIYADGVVRLRWDNPAVEDFAGVRVMSSDRFYPTDRFDGYLVYDGEDEAVVDQRSVESNVRYYTIFAYDAEGNVSSGAVTRVQFTPVDQIVDDTIDVVPASGTSSLRFSDIVFTIGAVTYTVNEDRVRIPQVDQTKISIPYNLLPEHLKTIVITLTDPHDASLTFSFLLRVNAEKTAYEAVIGRLPEFGTYLMEVEIFDFKTNTLESLSGFVELEPTPTQPQPVFNWWTLTLLLLLLLLLLLILRWYVRQRDDSAQTPEDSELLQ